MKEYKKQMHMKTWNCLKRRLKKCTLVKFLPHWPTNSQDKNDTCPVIKSAMDDCDKVKNRTPYATWMMPLSTKSVPVF